MKVKYEFVTGENTEVEVSEEIGAVILESKRNEDNLARKERYHCYSIDGIDFEGDEFGTEETPETIYEDKLESESLMEALSHLSETQRKRLIMYSDGLSSHEIARIEGVDHKAVLKSIEGARKKIKKIYKK